MTLVVQEKDVLLIAEVEDLLLDREKGVLVRGAAVQQSLRPIAISMFDVRRRNVSHKFLRQTHARQSDVTAVEQ